MKCVNGNMHIYFFKVWYLGGKLHQNLNKVAKYDSSVNQNDIFETIYL